MLLAAASLMVLVLGVVGEGSALAVSSSSSGTITAQPERQIGTTAVVCPASLGDCTGTLQQSLNGSGQIVVGPRGGASAPFSWPTRPLQLRSHTHISFLQGIEVAAVAGEFHGGGDCLFTTTPGTTNVTIVGWGATWRMRRSDYADNRTYSHSEWRAGLLVVHSSFVRVVGLKITETGGDGIYVIRSSDLLIDSVVVDRCYRQGISVIAAKNMLVVNSTFSRTGQGTLGTGVQMGTPPMCGVDLEPDQYEDSFINVTFDSCRATENFGCGFAVALSRSTNATPPLSVVFRNCSVSGVSDASATSPPPPIFCSAQDGCAGYAAVGFSVFGAYAFGNGVPGTILVDRCSISRTFDSGISLSNVAASNLQVQLVDTSLQFVAIRPQPLNASRCTDCPGSSPLGTGSAVVCSFDPGYGTGDLESTLFVSNLTVEDDRRRPWAAAVGCGGHASSRVSPVTLIIKGGGSSSVRVRNPTGCAVGPNVELALDHPVACNPRWWQQ